MEIAAPEPLRLRALPGRWAPPTAWAALVLAGHLLGARLYARDYRVHIGAPPLVGSFDAHLGAGLVPAVAFGAGAVVWGPALAAGLRWRALLAATWLAACAWAVALAASAGLDAIAAPLRTRYEYLT